MNRCYNCMEEFDGGVCPHCGYDNTASGVKPGCIVPGTVIKERYSIGNSVGRDAFGITYTAWDNLLSRKASIKEYFPDRLASRKAGSLEISFDNEAKNAFNQNISKVIEDIRKIAGLKSFESVVSVYDFFRENHTAYIVTEPLEGKSLGECLNKIKKISLDEMLKIITPVLDTLSAVHKAGIIHGSISPDNIFLCKRGKIKLLDFGFAKTADGADEKSRSVIFKPGYAPAEQYSPDGGQGAYTDIYSVCAVMYKMLTGITPQNSVERAGTDNLKNISELVNIPDYTAKAIMKGLNVQPEKRVQSAGELAALLKGESVFPFADDGIAAAGSDVAAAVGKDIAAAVTEDDAPAMPAENKSRETGSNTYEDIYSDSSAPLPPEKLPEPDTPDMDVHAFRDIDIKPAAPDVSETAGNGQPKKNKLVPVIAAVCVVAVAVAACVLVPKLKNAHKAEELTGSSLTEVNTTVKEAAKILTETTAAETTTGAETTTAKTTETTTGKAATTKAEATSAVETTAESTTANGAVTYGYINTDGKADAVTVYKSADKASETLKSLEHGSKVEVISTNGDWSEIKLKNSVGYVLSSYISNTEPVELAFGKEKNGVFYNDMVDAKFEIPTGWKKTTDAASEELQLDEKYPMNGFAYVGRSQFDHTNGVVFSVYDKDLDTVLKDFEIDKSSLTKETLAGKEYLHMDTHVVTGLVIKTNCFTDYYFKQVNGKTVLIRLVADTEPISYELQHRFSAAD